MSRSRKLQLQITQIEEMRTILNSMKNLAVIETHKKMSRFLATQWQVVANIENAAMDFLSFYHFLPEPGRSTDRICILMGSERGFCGDFNERLIDVATTGSCSGLIAIGSRLSSRLENNLSHVMVALAGANATKEVPVILDRLIDTIGLLQKTMVLWP